MPHTVRPQRIYPPPSMGLDRLQEQLRSMEICESRPSRSRSASTALPSDPGKSQHPQTPNRSASVSAPSQGSRATKLTRAPSHRKPVAPNAWSTPVYDNGTNTASSNARHPRSVSKPTTIDSGYDSIPVKKAGTRQQPHRAIPSPEPQSRFSWDSSPDSSEVNLPSKVESKPARAVRSELDSVPSTTRNPELGSRPKAARLNPKPGVSTANNDKYRDRPLPPTTPQISRTQAQQRLRRKSARIFLSEAYKQSNRPNKPNKPDLNRALPPVPFLIPRKPLPPNDGRYQKLRILHPSANPSIANHNDQINQRGWKHQPRAPLEAAMPSPKPLTSKARLIFKQRQASQRRVLRAQQAIDRGGWRVFQASYDVSLMDQDERRQVKEYAHRKREIRRREKQRTARNLGDPNGRVVKKKRARFECVVM